MSVENRVVDDLIAELERGLAHRELYVTLGDATGEYPAPRTPVDAEHFTMIMAFLRHQRLAELLDYDDETRRVTLVEFGEREPLTGKRIDSYVVSRRVYDVVRTMLLAAPTPGRGGC